MNKAIIHIRENNDCDHFVPIIFRLLESEWQVVIIPMYGFNYKNDHRINFLLENFHSLKIYNLSKIYSFKSTFLYKVLIRFNYKNTFIKAIFKIINFPFKVFEKDLFHDNPSLIWDWGNPGRINHFEALLYERPTIAFPHGIDIFLNRYKEKIDLSNRSIYDFYFLNSDFHIDVATSLLNINSHKLFKIGSPRFSKNWISKLIEFQNSFNFGKKDSKKILYFLPHADHAPNFQEIEDLIFQLSNIDNISLVLKMSTRQKNIFIPSSSRLSKNTDKVYFDFDTPSTSLIAWSDIVINHGSSIVFDALQLSKVVIHASFLDNLKTIFDESDCIYHAYNFDDIFKIIESSDAYPVKNSSQFLHKFVNCDNDNEPIDEVYNFLLSLQDK